MSDELIEVDEGTELATIAEYALGDLAETLDELATLDPEDGYAQSLIESAREQISRTRDYLKLTLVALIKAVEQRNEEITRRVKLERGMRDWHAETVASGMNIQIEHLARMMAYMTGCDFDTAYTAIMWLDDGDDTWEEMPDEVVEALTALADAAEAKRQEWQDYYSQE